MRFFFFSQDNLFFLGIIYEYSLNNWSESFPDDHGKRNIDRWLTEIALYCIDYYIAFLLAKCSFKFPVFRNLISILDWKNGTSSKRYLAVTGAIQKKRLNT